MKNDKKTKKPKNEKNDDADELQLLEDKNKEHSTTASVEDHK